MGKRKDFTFPEENIKLETMESQQKKHKRHKHKRHRKRKDQLEDFDSDASIDVSFEDGIDLKPAFKVKIKMNKDSPTTSAADLLKAQTSKLLERKIPPSPIVNTSPKVVTKKKKGKGRDSGTSSEEERWLDAIESGKLEEVDDELKKIKPKDPKMMTARQRAMYDRGNDKDMFPGGEVLLALPSGYKEKVMTAEAIQKAALKSQKRKQLADEKREKDKKKTMERLLKKQESKVLKCGLKSKPIKKNVPLITYRNTKDGITVSMPPDVDYPIRLQGPVEPPKVVICGVPRCTNLKRYSCSRTGVPLCSLGCYKRNLISVIIS